MSAFLASYRRYFCVILTKTTGRTISQHIFRRRASENLKKNLWPSSLTGQSQPYSLIVIERSQIMTNLRANFYHQKGAYKTLQGFGVGLKLVRPSIWLIILSRIKDESISSVQGFGRYERCFPKGEILTKRRQITKCLYQIRIRYAKYGQIISFQDIQTNRQLCDYSFAFFWFMRVQSPITSNFMIRSFVLEVRKYRSIYRGTN